MITAVRCTSCGRVQPIELALVSNEAWVCLCGMDESGLVLVEIDESEVQTFS